MMSLTQMAVDVLTFQNGRGKTALSLHYANIWFEARANGTVIDIETVQPPLQPALPEKTHSFKLTRGAKTQARNIARTNRTAACGGPYNTTRS